MGELIMIGGLSGSGKTTISKLLAKSRKAVFIDKDTVTSGLVDQMMLALGRPAHDRDSQDYLKKVRPAEYQCFLDTVLENVELGTKTIACAPFLAEFSSAEWRASIESRVAATCPRTKISYFWIDCDLETTRKRISFRDNLRDRLKMEVWHQYAAFAGTIAIPEAPVVGFDNSDPHHSASVAREIDTYLNQFTVPMTGLNALGRDPRNRPYIGAA